MILLPDWDRPPSIRMVVTDRLEGMSYAPFNAFNLAAHVGDDEECVMNNRQVLCEELSLKTQPVWLDQCHSNNVLKVEGEVKGLPAVDGVYTQLPGVPLVIMTADCMPILICNREGTEIAAVHAGWRGLASGIIKNVLELFTSKNLLVFLGPAIDVCHYEVDDLVRRQFDNTAAFKPSNKQFLTGMSGKDHWMFDLYGEASRQLNAFGVDKITTLRRCTYCEESLYSYRRDGETGRFVSLIWIE